MVGRPEPGCTWQDHTGCLSIGSNQHSHRIAPVEIEGERERKGGGRERREGGREGGREGERREERERERERGRERREGGRDRKEKGRSMRTRRHKVTCPLYIMHMYVQITTIVTSIKTHTQSSYERMIGMYKVSKTEENVYVT